MIHASIRAALLVLALLAIECAGAGGQAPAGWIEVAADNKFSLMAPAGTTFQRSSGADSFTGVFNAPGFAVQVDYGAYSDPLERDRERTQYFSRSTEIDGKPARLVTARERSTARAYFIAVHFPSVARSAVGAIRLTLTCHVDREQDYPLIEAVYRSVRFR